MSRKQSSVIVVFSPNVISLLFIRMVNSGTIYYTETEDWVSRFMLSRLRNKLRYLKVLPFSYTIGVGINGDGFLNDLLIKAGNLTDEFYENSCDKNLIEKFNQYFGSKNFHLFWKNYIYEKIWGTIVNYYGVLANYSPPFILYVPYKSCESLVVEKKLFETITDDNLKIKHFNNIFFRLFVSFAYFILTVIRFFLCGLKFTWRREKQDYKVMIEAVRNLKEEPFNLLEWWDKGKIDKNEILFISLTDKEPGRASSYKQAKDMGFHCAEINKRRKIPFAYLNGIVNCYLFFPFKNIYSLSRSINYDFFLLFLVKSFYWYLFFLNYRVSAFILNTYRENLKTLICNYFDCATIKYHLSYIGGLAFPEHKYFEVNHYLLWGRAQLHYSKDYISADRIYYTGCQGLSYFDKNKVNLMSGFSKIKLNRKNVVFFDTKVNKNLSNPEQFYFSFIELMLLCNKLLDVNVFFRPKAVDPFDDKLFIDKKRALSLREKIDHANIPILDILDYDVISVISMADIVVYSMVGTPSMIALMLGIPALSYCDHIEENPDPIIKHYLNELIFGDQEKLLEKIERILNGNEIPCLKENDKNKLNHYLDNKGLIRLQTIIADIVNDKEPPYSVKNIGEL